VASLDGLGDTVAEHVGIQWLLNVVVCAVLDGIDGRLDAGEAGHDNDLGGRAGGLDLAENIHAGEFVHHQVGADDVERTGRKNLAGPLWRGDDHALVAGTLQRFSHGIGLISLIIDDENCGSRRCLAHRGSPLAFPAPPVADG